VDGRSRYDEGEFAAESMRKLRELLLRQTIRQRFKSAAQRADALIGE
jgi:hypothetical protein